MRQGPSTIELKMVGRPNAAVWTCTGFRRATKAFGWEHTPEQGLAPAVVVATETDRRLLAALLAVAWRYWRSVRWQCPLPRAAADLGARSESALAVGQIYWRPAVGAVVPAHR